MPVEDMDMSGLMDQDLTSDGTVKRVTDSGDFIDTSLYSQDQSPTVPGFTDQDFKDQSERIKTTNVGMSQGKTEVNDQAYSMKKDIEESLEKGYDALSRGTKIRILDELIKKLKLEGEETRQASMSVRRV